MGSINQGKEKFWLSKMAEAERHGGSFESFCRIHRLSSATFAYWRKRFRDRKSKALVPMAKFIPVEISVPRPALPDPRWLAELIGHLVGCGR